MSVTLVIILNAIVAAAVVAVLVYVCRIPFRLGSAVPSARGATREELERSEERKAA